MFTFAPLPFAVAIFSSVAQDVDVASRSIIVDCGVSFCSESNEERRRLDRRLVNRTDRLMGGRLIHRSIACSRYTYLESRRFPATLQNLLRDHAARLRGGWHLSWAESPGVHALSPLKVVTT